MNGTAMLWLQFAVVFLLILLNGFFTLAEMAVVSARRVRLQRAADLGSVGARIALDLKQDSGRFFSTVQIGITVIGVLASVFGGAAFAHEVESLLAPYTAYAESMSYVLVVIAISYLTLILGELVPKRVALNRPEAIAIRLAWLIRVMAQVAAPVAWFLSFSSNLVLRLVPGRATEPGPVTEEEITIMLREAQAAGQVHPAETAIVQMALRLGDRRVNAVMTPRTQVEWLDLSESDDEIRAAIRNSSYSRFPVFDGGPAQVAGVVHVRDLALEVMSGQPFNLKRQLRPALYIPETATALRALEVFRKSGDPMALVVDEFGDFQGLVTLDDVMQSLVGEIAEQGEAPNPSVERREDGSMVIDGMTALDSVKDLTGLATLPGEDDADFHTLGGYLMARMNRIPAVGNKVAVAGFEFEVLGMDGRRVDKVLIVPPPKPEAEEEQDG